MKNTLEAEKYFAVPMNAVQGTEDDPIRCIYQRADNFLSVRKITVEAKRHGKPIDICQITDLHFNILDCEDFAENDPCVISTYENRLWLRGGVSLQNAIRAIEYGTFCDQLVVTGDILDYYSHGALSYTKKYLWDACPDAIACLGGHDVTRQMQGTVADTMPMEEKLRGLQEIWGHDIQYYSRLLDGRVMAIQMNNDCGAYTARQIELLSDDLELARKMEYTVLLFQHEPFATCDPRDTSVENIRVGDGSSWRDYCNNGVGHFGDIENAVFVRELVLAYSDVVRGIFCGHMHNDVYTELKSPSGCTIPQHILTANAYQNGSVLHITVK